MRSPRGDRYCEKSERFRSRFWGRSIYVELIGRGSLFTGRDDNALINESALFRAHGRISDRAFVGAASAFLGVTRFDFPRGFCEVGFMPGRIMEGTFWRKF
jgi:hypothetical protein